jgi:hypothetical protein
MARLAASTLKKLALNNLRMARVRWPNVPKQQLLILRELTVLLRLAIRRNELLWIANSWYVSHAGLLRLAERRRCSGIHTQIILKSSNPPSSHWVFKATVFKSSRCKGFTGYGDADPSNVSSVMHGAEMRIAETRAVNRALRKAYGIGICSVEEVGSFVGQSTSQPDSKKRPMPTNGNGNFGGRTVRDRLCQLIRQHQLDAALVKSYATEFCGVKLLRDATREQVENFVAHLADWAEKDRNALLCQLNSYSRAERGAA